MLLTELPTHRFVSPILIVRRGMTNISRTCSKQSGRPKRTRNSPSSDNLMTRFLEKNERRWYSFWKTKLLQVEEENFVEAKSFVSAESSEMAMGD